MATFPNNNAMANLFTVREHTGQAAIDFLGRLESGVATFEGRFNGYISNPELSDRGTTISFLGELADLELLRRDAEEHLAEFCAADDSYRDGLRFWGSMDGDLSYLSEEDRARVRDEMAARERILDRHYGRTVFERARDVRTRTERVDASIAAAVAVRTRILEEDRSYARIDDNCVDSALHDAFERRQFFDKVREADRDAALRDLDTPEISRLGARARATYDSNRKDAEILLTAMEWRIRVEVAREHVAEARTEKGRARRLEEQRQIETYAREVLEGYAERNAVARELLEEMYHA